MEMCLCGEDVEHMLLTCHWTRVMWKESCFGLEARQPLLIDVGKVYRRGFERYGKEVVRIKRHVAYTVSMIWKIRSEVIVGA